nr:PLAT/LH2 domain-containing protein [Paenibacillus xylanexedens]
MPFNYNATVHTSSDSGAGTNENIYLKLYGTQGDDGDWYLDYDGYNDTERGDVDTYILEAEKFLGPITKILLYVESNDNDSPAWKLDYIEITATYSGETKSWKFPVYRWIGIPGKDTGMPDTINYVTIGYDGVISSSNSSDIASNKKAVKYGKGYKKLNQLPLP